MATVIDELVLLFGIDDTKFRNEANRVSKDTQKLKDTSVKNMKQTEQGLLKLGKGIVEVQKYAMGLMTALVGASGIVQFTSQIISAEAALGRLSDHTGQATESLQAMGNIAELMGGKAEEAFSSAQRFSTELTNFRFKSEVGPMLTFLRDMRVSPLDAANNFRSYNDVLLDIAGNFEKSKLSKDEFFSLASAGGLDSGTIDAMMKGRAELEKLFKQQEKVARVTYEQAKAARELQRRWYEMKQQAMAWAYDIFSKVRPYLENFLDIMQKVADWFSQHKDFVIGALTALAVVLTATFLPAIIAVTAAIAPVLILAAAIGLLWEDYQVWKRGGDSLIAWDKWSAEIKPAIDAVERLTSRLVDLFNSLDGKENLAKVLKSIANTIAQEFGELVNMIANVATALDYVAQGEYLKAAYYLGTKYTKKQIDAMTKEDLAKPVPTEKLVWDLGVGESLQRVGDAALEPWGAGSKTNNLSLFRDNPNRNQAVGTGTVLALGVRNNAADIQNKQKHLKDLEAGYKLPPGILDAVWYQESRRGQNARKSPAGAKGDFQFMPDTAKDFNVDVKDFYSSASGAAKYLSWLSNRYNGDVAKMLAGYNAGPGNVDKYKGVPPFKETRGYVTDIMARMRQGSGQTTAALYPAGARAQAELSQGAANKSVTNHVQTNISSVNIHTSGDGKKIAQDFTSTLNGLGITPFFIDTGMN